MEIGQKLKRGRTAAGLTQELVAEKIGVSRQTISSWENNRSFPDIVSVIKLSDLYSVSLDELLKEDENLILHLEESTNTVQSQRKFTLTVRAGILAECVILSLVFSFGCLWLVPNVSEMLSLVIHILPAIFAQCFFCTISRWKLVNVLPVILTTAFALWGIWLYNTSPHWQYATFSDLMIDYVSPAIACGAVFGLYLLFTGKKEQ